MHSPTVPFGNVAVARTHVMYDRRIAALRPFGNSAITTAAVAAAAVVVIPSIQK